MTPQEMADFLATIHGQFSATHRHFAYPQFVEIAAYLRKQPTEAQKIEALQHVVDAASFGEDAERMDYSFCDPDATYRAAVEATRRARKALRLLGIEDPA